MLLIIFEKSEIKLFSMRILWNKLILIDGVYFVIVCVKKLLFSFIKFIFLRWKFYVRIVIENVIFY